MPDVTDLYENIEDFYNPEPVCEWRLEPKTGTYFSACGEEFSLLSAEGDCTCGKRIKPDRATPMLYNQRRTTQ